MGATDAWDTWPFAGTGDGVTGVGASTFAARFLPWSSAQTNNATPITVPTTVSHSTMPNTPLSPLNNAWCCRSPDQRIAWPGFLPGPDLFPCLSAALMYGASRTCSNRGFAFKAAYSVVKLLTALVLTAWVSGTAATNPTARRTSETTARARPTTAGGTLNAARNMAGATVRPGSHAQ